MMLTSCLDIALLSVILVCGFEVVRLLHPRRQPWLTVSFVLITVGAFGWMNFDIAGQPVPWFAVAAHGGFALGTLLVLLGQRVAQRSYIAPLSCRGQDWSRDPVHRP